MLPHTDHPVLALRERLQRVTDRWLKRPYAEWYASDNQFPSRLRMDRAHAPIVAVAAAALAGRGGNVLDLGCGNGALLRKIHDADPAVVPFGIDAVRSSIEHARLLLPAFADHFVGGDMLTDEFPWIGDRRYALAVLAPARLLETTAERAATLRDRLKLRCNTLVVYAYGKSLTRHGDLAGLCRATGLHLRAPAARAGLAEIV